MDTRVMPAGPKACRKAAALLRQGAVVAIPTETVYGLAANALNPAAVQGIFAAKGRPQDNPLIVHISHRDMLGQVVSEWPETAQKLADAFWPGPLTLVLPKAAGIPVEVTAGLSSVGVRMPAHSAAKSIIEAAGVPLAAPSANRSGAPSPTSARHVLQDMQGRIPLVVDGGRCPVGVESTVLSLVEGPVLLRPGFVTREEIEETLEEPVGVAGAVQQPLQEGEQPQSPGMKYKHYAPKAQLTLVRGTPEAFTELVQQRKEAGLFALCFEEMVRSLPVPAVSYGAKDDLASQAEGLFAALRELDERGAKTVLALSPEPRGVGLAVYNRLLRAAAFREEVL